MYPFTTRSAPLDRLWNRAPTSGCTGRRWRGLLPGLAVAALLSLGLGSPTAQAQGLGDFSAPPPEPVKREPKTPPKKAPPRRPAPRPAAPPYEEMTWFSRTAVCSGRSQSCEEVATWPLETEFDDDYYLKIAVPARHCSPLYLDFELDGRFLGSSGLLGPGLTEVLALGRVSKGSHVLRISAFGREGGCNRGVLESWGVDLVMSNNPANKALALAPSKSVRASRQASAAPTGRPALAEPAPPLPPVRQAEPVREEPPAKRAPRQSSRMLVMNVSRNDLTEAGAYYLKIAVQQAKDDGVGALIVNLEPIVVMNDAGIAALEESEAMFGKGNFVIMQLRGEPRRFLETHAPGRFKVYDTKDAAVSALSR